MSTILATPSSFHQPQWTMLEQLWCVNRFWSGYSERSVVGISFQSCYAEFGDWTRKTIKVMWTAPFSRQVRLQAPLYTLHVEYFMHLDQHRMVRLLIWSSIFSPTTSGWSSQCAHVEHCTNESYKYQWENLLDCLMTWYTVLSFWNISTSPRSLHGH